MPERLRRGRMLTDAHLTAAWIRLGAALETCRYTTAANNRDFTALCFASLVEGVLLIESVRQQQTRACRTAARIRRALLTQRLRICDSIA